MRNIALILFLLIPSFVFAQKAVGPEGYKLFWMAVLIVAIIAFQALRLLFRKKSNYRPKRKFRLKRKKLEITIKKDRLIRPKVLTVKFKNTGKTDIDLLAPLFIFRKLWSKRKFKLKKVNNKEVYPLYLETGKEFLLTIELTRFFEHDRKLKRFYWGRIVITDADGKIFKSEYVTLRKSLYS